MTHAAHCPACRSTVSTWGAGAVGGTRWWFIHGVPVPAALQGGFPFAAAGATGVAGAGATGGAGAASAGATGAPPEAPPVECPEVRRWRDPPARPQARPA